MDDNNIVTRFSVCVYHLCVPRIAKDCVVCVGNEFFYFRVSSNYVRVCACVRVCVILNRHFSLSPSLLGECPSVYS